MLVTAGERFLAKARLRGAAERAVQFHRALGQQMHEREVRTGKPQQVIRQWLGTLCGVSVGQRHDTQRGFARQQAFEEREQRGQRNLPGATAIVHELTEHRERARACTGAKHERAERLRHFRARLCLGQELTHLQLHVGAYFQLAEQLEQPLAAERNARLRRGEQLSTQRACLARQLFIA